MAVTTPFLLIVAVREFGMGATRSRNVVKMFLLRSKMKKGEALAGRSAQVSTDIVWEQKKRAWIWAAVASVNPVNASKNKPGGDEERTSAVMRAHTHARCNEKVGLRIESYCTFQAINSSAGVRPLCRHEANERGRWAGPRRRFEPQELIGAGQVPWWSLCALCSPCDWNFSFIP